MDDEYKFWQYLIPYEASKYTMGLARTIHNKGKLNLRNIYAHNSSKWLGKTGAIIHGGDYPTAFYYNDKDNNFYQKGWDLNDYGKDENKERKGTYSTYDNFERFAANALDFIGNPMVISTGYRQTPYNINNITLAPGRTRHPTAFITLQRQFNTWLKKHKRF